MNGDREETVRYATGWRPELCLHETVLGLIAIVFNPESTVEECEMAATTIVEAIHPEILRKATEEDRRLWEAETER